MPLRPSECLENSLSIEKLQPARYLKAIINGYLKRSNLEPGKSFEISLDIKGYPLCKTQPVLDYIQTIYLLEGWEGCNGFCQTPANRQKPILSDFTSKYQTPSQKSDLLK